MSTNQRTLSFNAGSERNYVINGVEVTLAPTDPNFLNRYRTMVADLCAEQDAMIADLEELDASQLDKPAEEMTEDELDELADNGDRVLEITRAHDAAMRTIIDAGPVECDDSLSSALFGDHFLTSLAGGQPLWVNFVECLSNEMEYRVKAERKNAENRPIVRDKRYMQMVQRYRSKR